MASKNKKRFDVTRAEVYSATDASGRSIPETYTWHVQAFDFAEKEVFYSQSTEVFAKLSEARLALSAFVDTLEATSVN